MGRVIFTVLVFAFIFTVHFFRALVITIIETFTKGDNHEPEKEQSENTRGQVLEIHEAQCGSVYNENEMQMWWSATGD